MAPKAKSISGTNFGSVVTALVERMDHLEQAYKDLNRGSSERVLDRMHELEKLVRKHCDDLLHKCTHWTTQCLQRERESEKNLEVHTEKCNMLIQKMQTTSSKLKAEMHQVEKAVENRICDLLTGVDNRFKNETEMSLRVINSKVDDALSKLSIHRERGILESALPRQGTTRVQSYDSLAPPRGRQAASKFKDLQDNLVRRSRSSSLTVELAYEAQKAARFRSPRNKNSREGLLADDSTADSAHNI